MGRAKTNIHVHIAQMLLATKSSHKLLSLRLGCIRRVGVRGFVSLARRGATPLPLRSTAWRVDRARWRRAAQQTDPSRRAADRRAWRRDARCRRRSSRPSSPPPASPSSAARGSHAGRPPRAVDRNARCALHPPWRLCSVHACRRRARPADRRDSCPCRRRRLSPCRRAPPTAGRRTPRSDAGRG